MYFKLDFNMDNASFDDNPEFEAREILKQTGREIIQGKTFGAIRDVNGNTTIGKWEIVTD